MAMISALLPAALLAGLLASDVARAADAQLQALARTVVGADQGVFVQAGDGSVLVEQHADRAVHPASVVKIATTLALLRVLGPEHRFQTRVLASGPVRDGAIHGDLVVESEGDPVLVVLDLASDADLQWLPSGLWAEESSVRGDGEYPWQPTGGSSTLSPGSRAISSVG